MVQLAAGKGQRKTRGETGSDRLMETWHIHIEGQVQGVGFRPFVFLLAKKHGLHGWVNNAVDGVHVVFNADENIALVFKNKLIEQAPILSKITAVQINRIQQKFFENFQIVHSENSGKANLLLTPDFALCVDCKNELFSDSNRRRAYPFITCTNCGPRYSIVHRLPYDRINTTMDDFEMCSNCKNEYENPLDRRYYSQTNSCPDCQVELSLFDSELNNIEKNQEKIIEAVVQAWEEGAIVAIKGIGGYLLTCDANNKAAVVELRKRKYRPSKPLAVMYPTITQIEERLMLSEEEKQELMGHVSPIVILNAKDNSEQMEVIAPGLKQVGVMLPYTPIYQLLLKKFGRPIIATSGNLSNSPIVFHDEKALKEPAPIADLILMNNRKITIPQDDSVVKYSFYSKQKIIVRRSRGLAPTYINPQLEWPQKSILATGAMLKSTFSFLHQSNIYISQYLGDLENFDTQENYRHTIRHFFNLFNAQPEYILADMHPGYASTVYGENLSQELGVPIEKIQHHMAHFGAVLGEHNLLHSEEPVLGIVWDGTGLGDDGQVWGGEFFKYENYDFLRCYHFDYFDFILGDKMPKEPRVSALSACWDVMGAEEYLKFKFSNTEWEVYSKLLKKQGQLQTSSMGRIFDAVASLLGVMDGQTYEGEAAMRLESIAAQYFKKNGLGFSESYFKEGAHYYRIPTKTLMTNIILDLKKGKAKEFIAAKFHYSLMKIIKIVADNLKIKKIAFSGGVIQNGVLVDLIHHHLNTDFKLYFHQQLSPNDENISFGQLVCHQIGKYKKLLLHKKSKNHVFSDSR